MSLDRLVPSLRRRRAVLVLTLLFLLTAPSAFALGGPAEGFDFLGFAKLWHRAVEAWGGDGVAAPRVHAADVAAGPGFEKLGSSTDPYGNPAANTPPATSTTSSAAGPTMAPTDAGSDG